ncbi:hypothetical protein ACIOHE_14920 [Streptomyces sp. NPDC087851]|uniref:hypothetical protein n=1 Tax=Streptomyces sp. NPDC087851 TaxID=3365810 RepID=UPI003802741A
MRHVRLRSLCVAAASLTLLPLSAACSGSEATEPTSEDGSKSATATAEVRSLTAAELKAALLTEEEATGFDITGTETVKGAGGKWEDPTTVKPAACKVLWNAETKGFGETAAATSILYPASNSIDTRETLLAAFPADAARARMTSLRKSLATCGEFETKNQYGQSSEKTDELEAPGLGDEAIRFRTAGQVKTATVNKGQSHRLTTVVRTGNVVTRFRSDVLLGDLEPDQVARFIPKPDEALIAAQIAKVEEAIHQDTKRHTGGSR